MEGLNRVESVRADFHKAALTLEDGGLAAVLAGDDHAGVSIEEPQAVVVLRHKQRPADIPGVLGKAVEFARQPALDDGVPGGDAVGAATVGAEQAEGAERGDRGGGIAAASGLDDISAGGDGRLAYRSKRFFGVGLGDVDFDPLDVAVTGAQDGKRCLGVAAADGLGQVSDRAREAMDAAEDDDAVSDRAAGGRLGRGHGLLRDLGEARPGGLAHQQPVGGRSDEISKHGACLDRRELPWIADEDQPRVATDRLEQASHQRERHHRRLVDDDDVVR